MRGLSITYSCKTGHYARILPFSIPPHGSRADNGNHHFVSLERNAKCVEAGTESAALSSLLVHLFIYFLHFFLFFFRRCWYSAQMFEISFFNVNVSRTLARSLAQITKLNKLLARSVSVLARIRYSKCCSSQVSLCICDSIRFGFVFMLSFLFGCYIFSVFGAEKK